MLYLEIEESSVKKATEVALKQIGLKEEEVRVEVLQKEKRSLLGIGSPKLAKIRVHYKEKNVAELLIKNIKEMIHYLDDQCSIEVKKKEQNRYHLVVSTPDISHLVGKQGRTLEALQSVVNTLLQRHENRYKIIVEIGKYHLKKEHHLIEWAEAQARKVLETKRPTLLKPLNSYERRLIHIELEKFKNLHTESKGSGSKKNIRITYRQNP